MVFRKRNLRRSYSGRAKITQPDLIAFGKKAASQERTLIIFSEFPHEDMIRNADVLPRYQHDCGRYFPLLEQIPDENYQQVIAMGVLEHVKEPERLIRECHRILKSGGKLFLSASSVFPVHRGPDNYFHFTHFGMLELLSFVKWENIDMKGSCGPFKTIAILLQRILLQCETKWFVRPFLYLMVKTIPFLDSLIICQYADRGYSESKKIDSMMPSNIQVIAVK